MRHYRLYYDGHDHYVGESGGTNAHHCTVYDIAAPHLLQVKNLLRRLKIWSRMVSSRCTWKPITLRTTSSLPENLAACVEW